MANTAYLQFYSGNPIDKITVQGSTSYSLTGSPTPATATHSISNPYGLKCLTNVSWSIDNTNFYDQDDEIWISIGQTLCSLKVGVSDSDIYFYLTNSTNGNTYTFYINYTLYSIS